MDLQDAIKYLAPFAEALVTLNSKVDALAELEAKADEYQTWVTQAKADQAEAEAAKVEALAGVETAKTELIEVTAKIDSMIASARAVAAKIIDDAKAQAIVDIEAIKDSQSNTIALLNGEKTKLEADIVIIRQKIKDARIEHDQVLASMGSLTRRLQGAA